MNLPSVKPTSLAPLTDSQERYALHYTTYGDPVAAYQHAYNPTTTRRASLQQLAYRVRNHPRVAARIIELRNAQAAGDPALTAQALVADLQAMVDVDPETLQQIRVVPCAECWTDDALVAAVGRPNAPLPDVDSPRDDCAACAGAGRLVGHVTPSAELPLAARRLIKGIEFFPGGSVKRVIYHDQATLRTELHKLKGMHVDRSINLNVNANIAPLKDMSRDEALALLERIAPSAPEPAPMTVDAIPAENP